MKLKINQVLEGVEEKLKDEKGHDLTFKMVAINSILRPVQADDEKVKMNKYEIYVNLRDAKTEVELTVDQIALLKKSIGAVQPPLIMGQCFNLIEQK
jgi:hypothetical protein